MDTHEEDDVAPRAADTRGTEANISHFIPSVELKGSRADKLKTLDTLIAHHERLRRSLAGDTPVTRGGFEGPSRHIGSPAWPWFTAGAFLGALFVLLMIFSKGCGYDFFTNS